MYLKFLSFIGALLAFPLWAAAGETGSLTDWVVEDSSAKVEITCRKDTMDIVSPDGLTLWYKHRLTGDYEITYQVQAVMAGGTGERFSELNRFGGAGIPLPPDLFFEGGGRA